MRNIKDIDIDGQNIIVRVDFNVPVVDNKITDKTRIERSLPTLKYLLQYDCRIIIITHFGRPKTYHDTKYSLSFLLPLLRQHFPDIALAKDITNAHNLDSKVILLENIRFFPGETTNDINFAKKLANLGNIYVNDAFSCCHRNHASVAAISHILPSYIGLSLQQEIIGLKRYLVNAAKPFMAIIGGKKLDSKLPIIKNLLKHVDIIFIGGAMANTFFKAQNIDIGNSIFESEHISTAQQILKKTNKVILPYDFVVASNINSKDTFVANAGDNINGKQIFDIGPRTINLLIKEISQVKTVMWNGPVGAFELAAYSKGTLAIAKNIVDRTKAKQLVSVIGGGDSLASVSTIEDNNSFSLKSTGGGAFLEWLTHFNLPGLNAFN